MPKDEPVTKTVTMSEIDLNILIKFINKFDGSREKLNAFINNCRNAITLASANQQDILLKYILSQLEGRAESACSIKNFENWQQLEDFLKAQYGDRKHYAALLSDLQDCRQLSNETVNQFALRVESCLSKLMSEINISIPTTKKGELTGRLAAMQDLALHTFVSGLNPRLSTVVRCRDPEALNDAINFAVSEEKIFQATSRRNPNFGHSSNQNPNHPGRFRQFPQQNRSIPQHGMNNNHMTSPPFRPIASLVCRYCKFAGHTIDKCRKREYNNMRFGNPPNGQNNGPSSNSFNQNRNQPIHAIESCEENDLDENNALNE